MVEIFRAEDARVGAWGSLVVTYYERAPTVSATRALMSATKSWRVTAGKDRLAILVVLELDTHTGPPEPEVRQELLAHIRQLNTHAVALAYVVRGEGFAAAIARAIISGMLLWLQPKFKTSVFARVEQGLEWLEGKVPALEPVLVESRTEIRAFCRRVGPAHVAELPRSP